MVNVKQQLEMPIVDGFKKFQGQCHLLCYQMVVIVAGLHHPSARRRKLSLARRVLGLNPAVPELKEFSLWDWLVELFGEDEISRCPYCGVTHSLHWIRDELGALTWVQRMVLITRCNGLTGFVRGRGAPGGEKSS